MTPVARPTVPADVTAGVSTTEHRNDGNASPDPPAATPVELSGRRG
jgi:hypothetical protein